MAYSINPEDLASITDLELAFGTTRFLPPADEIPEEFWRGNDYTKLAEAIFFGRPLPDFEVLMKEGVEPSLLNKVVRSHLQSFEPKHEHKIAGVGYLIQNLSTLEPVRHRTTE